MAKNQKSYTPEFKQQIVDLYNSGGTSYPQLEREYGVSKSTLSTWIKQLSPVKISEEQTVTLKEYKALQKENQRLKIENEICLSMTAELAVEAVKNACLNVKNTQGIPMTMPV
ncbi:transposase [Bacteroides sp.]|uniref:transposase n=1 Tax=Bacteroides sp. TaxID=29523 RepID=UPI00258DEF2F|nr:transposase [Bacteroides sp.]